MDSRDLQEIEKFLSSVGKASLFAYYQLDTNTGDDQVEEAIKKRRTWAQGQQANPKYRTEALWIIKNVNLVKKAMVDSRSEYLTEVEQAEYTQKLEILATFIKGALVTGVLSPQMETAILAQGGELGLPEHMVRERIERMLQETGASRESAPAPAAETEDDGEFVDYYEAIESTPDADFETLEKAYRARYRYARSLSDKTKAEAIYANLDAAWRVLKDEDKRLAYNEVWAAQKAPPEPEPMGPADMVGFLAPPPEPEPTPPWPGPAPILEPNPDTIATQPLPPPPEDMDAPTLGFKEVPGAPKRPGQPPGETRRRSPKDPRGRRTKAPPPSNIAGPTLGLNAETATPVEGRPKLQLSGARDMTVSVWRSPEVVRFTVRNVGKGNMKGTIHANAEWVSISPQKLNPNKREQAVQVTIHPQDMGKKRDAVEVTISCHHGDRKTITLRVEKTPPKKFIIAMTMALGMLFLVGAFGIGALVAYMKTPEETAPTARLSVEVDPPAGNVFANGELLGANGSMELTGGFPIGVPFELRVELDGFKAWTKEITVPEGGNHQEKVELELSDDMAYKPSANHEKGSVLPADVDKAILTQQGRFDSCFITNLAGRDFEAEVTAKGIIRARGYVASVDFDKKNYDNKSVDQCLKRELRALQMPLVKDGDYAHFDHEFKVKISAGGR